MTYLKRVQSMDDFEDYFLLKSDPSAVLWSGFATAPNKDNLRAHFEKVIHNPDAYLYLMYDESVPTVIGYGQFMVDENKEIEYHGTGVLIQYQGRGFSKMLTSLIMQEAAKIGVRRIIGWISEHNIPSIKSLLANGFHKTTETKVVKLQAFEREDKFEQYERWIG